MLSTVNVAKKTASEVSRATLSQLQLKKRYDLQESVFQNPRILGEDLLIITSEFSEFDKTDERLDVLAMDRSGVLSVAESKRSAVRTSAELQALRYAPYCSTMSLTDLSDLLAEFSAHERDTQMNGVEAKAKILGEAECARSSARRSRGTSRVFRAERACSESAGISPQVAVPLQRLAFERVTGLVC
jgi:hypothetical protein